MCSNGRSQACCSGQHLKKCAFAFCMLCIHTHVITVVHLCRRQKWSITCLSVARAAAYHTNAYSTKIATFSCRVQSTSIDSTSFSLLTNKSSGTADLLPPRCQRWPCCWISSTSWQCYWNSWTSLMTATCIADYRFQSVQVYHLTVETESKHSTETHVQVEPAW